jgi:hypothetical protein
MQRRGAARSFRHIGVSNTGKSKEQGPGNLASRDHETRNPEGFGGISVIPRNRVHGFRHIEIQLINNPRGQEVRDVLCWKSPKSGNATCRGVGLRSQTSTFWEVRGLTVREFQR